MISLLIYRENPTMMILFSKGEKLDIRDMLIPIIENLVSVHNGPPNLAMMAVLIRREKLALIVL